MARFVVLSFDNNEEAEDFTKALSDGTIFYTKPHDDRDYQLVELKGAAEALGLFMKPTQFCTCVPTGNSAQAKKKPFSQGKKYGLWVHTCGKPIAMSWENIGHKLTGFGYNLLIPEADRHEHHGKDVKAYYAQVENR